MRRFRFTALIMALLVSLSVLAGCAVQTAPPAENKPGEQKPAEPKPTNLVVYTAIHEFETSRLLARFTEQTGIKTEFIRLSSSALNARVIAEKAAPKGDVILGGPSDSHEALIKEGVLTPYKSPVLKDIDPQYYHADGFWSGFYVGALGIAINPARFKKDFPNEKEPATWDDLLNPKFTKAITISNPSSSGTAYSFLATQIFRLGSEEKAWEYLNKLHPNVAQYTSSGAAPATQTAAGEFAMGMSFGHDIIKPMAAGFQVKLVYPPDTGWEIGAVSVIKGGPNPKAAEMFVDWMLGKEAGQIHSDLSLRISTRKDVAMPPGAIPLSDIKLVKYDNKWAGDNKKRLTEEWNKRFSK